MYSFIFTSHGERSFQKLSQESQTRLIKKLKFFKGVSDIYVYANKLTNFPGATHRFRVGDIRIIVSQKSNLEFYVVDIGLRGDIYK